MAGAVAYSFTVKMAKRAKNQNAVKIAAYNSRDKLEYTNARDNSTETFNFRKGRSECVFSGIFAPKDAPEWMRADRNTPPEQTREIRQRIWNEIEGLDTRKNAQPARLVIAALPYQLSDEQRFRMVSEFVRENFTRKGMIADVSIHKPGEKEDDRNYHVHIMLTTRGIDRDGFMEDKYLGRQWGKKEVLAQWKDKFAQECSKQLKDIGLTVEADRWRHGHQTKEQQAAAATTRGDFDYAIECLGTDTQKHQRPTERGQHPAKEETQEQKNERLSLRDEVAALAREMLEVKREIAREERAALKVEPFIDARPGFRPAANETTRSVEPDLAPAPIPAPSQSERPLNETAGQIRMAYTLSDSGAGFAAALEERGLSLAAVSRDEAAASHRLASFAKETGHYAATFSPGEIVAVNSFGSVYALTERITGDTREDMKAYLSTVERAELLNVTDTREVMREINRAAYIEKRAADRVMTPIEKRVDEMIFEIDTGKAFVEKLGEAGIYLARADKDDLQRIRDEYTAATQSTPDAPPASIARALKIEEGELVAVTGNGHMHRLNPAKIDPMLLDALLTDARAEPLSVSQVRDSVQLDRDEREATWADLRAEAQDRRDKAADLSGQSANVQTSETTEGAHGLEKVSTGVASAAQFVMEFGIKPIAKAIEIAADMIAPTAPPTREQARLNRIAANENAEVRASRAEEKAQLDNTNKQNAQTNQEAEQQRLAQESAARRRRYEREDDYGRERERDR